MANNRGHTQQQISIFLFYLFLSLDIYYLSPSFFIPIILQTSQPHAFCNR